MRVTRGNVGSEKLGDWPSIVLDKGVWVHTLAFTPKLKWDYCIFSCILGPPQVHIFVMYISNYKCNPPITTSSPNSNPQVSKPSTQLLSLMLHYCGPFLTLPVPTACSLHLCVGTPKLHPGGVMVNSILTYSNPESYIHHAIYHFQLNDIIIVFFSNR